MRPTTSLESSPQFHSEYYLTKSRSSDGELWKRNRISQTVDIASPANTTRSRIRALPPRLIRLMVGILSTLKRFFHACLAGRAHLGEAF